MIQHLFKLILNKKKQNFLLITEMFVAFMVTFAVFTMLVYYYKNYSKPMGFDYENVWVISFNEAQKPGTADSAVAYMQTLKSSIKNIPGVEDVSFTQSNVPFSFNTFTEEVQYNKTNNLQVNAFNVEENYNCMFNIDMISGRWFTKADAQLKEQSVVINEDLAEKFFGNTPALGKIITSGEDGKKRNKIIGVMRSMKKDGNYANTEPAFFKPMNADDYQWSNTILVKVKQPADAAFEGRLYKAMNNLVKNANIEIEHFSDKLKNRNKLSLTPVIILIVVAGFLIINVALGLFGVLWYNINRRKAEIGLRRALGASAGNISKQLIGEAMVLSTLALIAGSFFAVQFPVLGVFDLPSPVYFTALIMAIAFIYLLVVICAFYPGKQAADIYPAIALHEE